MTPKEQELLHRFLQNLKTARVPKLDAAANKLICAAFAGQANAAYVVVQQALLQQLALTQAQDRIAELQLELNAAKAAQTSRDSTRFLTGHVHSGNGWRSTSPISARKDETPRTTEQSSTPDQDVPESFLQTPATTAAGLADGSVLFDGLGSSLAYPYKRYNNEPNDASTANTGIDALISAYFFKDTSNSQQIRSDNEGEDTLN